MSELPRASDQQAAELGSVTGRRDDFAALDLRAEGQLVRRALLFANDVLRRADNVVELRRSPSFLEQHARFFGTQFAGQAA